MELDPSVVDVIFEHAALRFILADGREVAAPLELFPSLRDATEAQRRNWRLIGRGIGVHWPDVDEDISVSTLLEGGHWSSSASYSKSRSCAESAVEVGHLYIDAVLAVLTDRPQANQLAVEEIGEFGEFGVEE